MELLWPALCQIHPKLHLQSVRKTFEQCKLVLGQVVSNYSQNTLGNNCISHRVNGISIQITSHAQSEKLKEITAIPYTSFKAY